MENKIEPIQAVERAMKLMELLSRRGTLSLSDLSKELQVGKASLLRLAYTLVQCGYIDKNATTGSYSLTMKPYEVGMSAVQNRSKISLISSTLAELSRATGRVAQFSVIDNNQLLCVQSFGQKSQFFSSYTDAGRRSPLYATSAGKALLATYTSSQILEMWSGFQIKQYTEHTITDPKALLQTLAEVQQKRYAVDREETEYGLFCIGAVVIGHSNLPMGAISISGSSLTPEEETSLSRVLLSTVTQLSNLLGYVAESGNPA